MNDRLLISLAVATALLWAKYVWVAMIQGRSRLKSKTFRYSEDAAHWGGTVEDPSSGELSRGERAQHMLRNDGESQPYFFVLAILYIWLGCAPALGSGLFIAYALLRWLHGLFLLNPRQPYRNIAYSTTLVIQLVMLASLLYQAFLRLN